MSSIITCVVVACTTGNRTKFIMKIARFSRLYLLYLSKGRENSRMGQNIGKLGCSPVPSACGAFLFLLFCTAVEKTPGKAPFRQRCCTTGANNRCEHMAGTLDAARSELETAGERQREIDAGAAGQRDGRAALRRRVCAGAAPAAVEGGKARARGGSGGAGGAAVLQPYSPRLQPYSPRL